MKSFKVSSVKVVWTWCRPGLVIIIRGRSYIDRDIEQRPRTSVPDKSSCENQKTINKNKTWRQINHDPLFKFHLKRRQSCLCGRGFIIGPVGGPRHSLECCEGSIESVWRSNTSRATCSPPNQTQTYNVSMVLNYWYLVKTFDRSKKPTHFIFRTKTPKGRLSFFYFRQATSWNFFDECSRQLLLPHFKRSVKLLLV